MRITYLGHAGLHIETDHASILCDPWLGGPAYYGSWWPFPDNDGVDREALSRPKYLYISHLHEDHFCEGFLRDHVSRDAIVLLPDYPLGSLRRELERVGFHTFLPTRSWEPVELDGLRITIPTMVSPTDGPIGDAGLIVEEGPVRIFNQNDSRPTAGLDAIGHVDLHFLQFSGGIGYPFLQGYPERMRVALGRRKRTVGMERARRYVEMVGADHFFPSSGPACFLHPSLFWLNDLGDDEGNVFPDQRRFLEYMREHGHHQGDVVLPGSVVELTGSGMHLRHPMSESQIERLFTPDGKREYLDEYRERKRAVLERLDDDLPRGQVDVARDLKEWWEPLLAEADLVCAGVNGRMAIDFEDEAEGVVVDFHDRTVEPWRGDAGEAVEHHFTFPRPLVEDCVLHRRENWSTDLLLSFRFRERSTGPFNKYLFAFLSALTPERIRYVEKFYRREAMREGGEGQPFFRIALGDRQRFIQQRCPHASADLRRFLEYDESTDTLTCTLHGWQWDSDGNCLTAGGHRLYVRPSDEVAAADEPASGGAAVRRHCADCWYAWRRSTSTR